MRTTSVNVVRIATKGPGDVAGLIRLIESGDIDPKSILAVLGKTEGNGGVNDFTREYAVSALCAALAPHLARDLKGRNDFEGLSTNRVYALLAKSPVFAELVTHPLALAFVEAELGTSCLLSACLAINLQPGETVQAWHTDDGGARLPRPRPALRPAAWLEVEPLSSHADFTCTCYLLSLVLSISKGGERCRSSVWLGRSWRQWSRLRWAAPRSLTRRAFEGSRCLLRVPL